MDNSFSQLLFPSVEGREISARFRGGDLTHDAGILLVAHADKSLSLVERMAAAIGDTRQANKVRHSNLDWLRERIYAICCGVNPVLAPPG